MKPLARWLGLVGLGGCTAVVAVEGITLIPAADHVGRCVVAVVAVLALCALGGMGLFFELLEDD